MPSPTDVAPSRRPDVTGEPRTRARRFLGRDHAAAGSSEFRPDIEGMRAIAIVAVVAYHAHLPGFGGGYVGVDVFFVISGFLITTQMLRTSGRSLFRFGDFYARRVRRLLPAATLTIVGTLVASVLFQSPLYQQTTAADARSAALFFSNFRFADQATDYFQQERLPSPFQQFWSLSVEEQFYFLWPAIFAVAIGGFALRSGSRRRLAAVVAAIAVVSFAGAVYLTSTNQPVAFFWLPSRAWELAVGAGLAIAAPRLAHVRLPLASALPWVGLALIAVPIVLYDDTTTFPGLAAAPVVLGSAMLIAVGIGGSGSPVASVLSTTPFQLGGRYSYSLYLWHWPVLVVAASVAEGVATKWSYAVVVVVVGALPLAVASHLLVERPIHTSTALRPRVRLTLLMGLGLIAVSVLASYAYAAAVGDEPLDAGRPVQAAPYDGGEVVPTEFVPSNVRPRLAPGIDVGADPAGCGELDACTFGDPDGEVTVEYFGDSHAAHWTPAFAAIADERSWAFSRRTKGSCGSFLVDPVRDVAGCDDWRDENFAALAEDPPDVVVLANFSLPAYRRDPEAWAEGVRGALRRLPDESDVVVLAATPDFKDEVPVCLAEHLSDTQACESRRIDELDDLNEVLREVVEDEGATFVDVTEWICTEGGRCPVVTEDLLVYRDKSHLTADFVRSRAPLLADALSEAGGLPTS